MYSSQFRFAGFIMTYERSDILPDTISKIFSQTMPPEKLLIVDNSESDKTKTLVDSLEDGRIEYLAVGYNAGPAGAAKIGLQKLSNEGFDWIYWGDDDDPPHFPDTFECLLNHRHNIRTGLLGVTGNRLSRLTGQLFRLDQNEIELANTQGKKWIEVDSVAGNQSMIVNGEVVRRGILPDSKLFFGFEELEFCLRVKKAGFRIYASSELFLRSRKKFARSAYSQPLYAPFSFEKLNRQYFSIRNILFILSLEKLQLARLIKTMKALLKIPAGYFQGIHYGNKNSAMIVLGLRDGWLNKFDGQNFHPKLK